MGKVPYGVLFDFASSNVSRNNLGFYPGDHVTCSVGKHSNSEIEHCQDSSTIMEAPCGCGCVCDDTSQVPQPEIRFSGAGLFFDGTIEGMQGVPFDVAITNLSRYTPWNSEARDCAHALALTCLL